VTCANPSYDRHLILSNTIFIMTGFSETSAPQPTEIPRSQGTEEETAQLRPELDAVDLYPERKANGYEGVLPQIVGDVPPEEQEAFPTFPDNQTGIFNVNPEDGDNELYEQMRAQLPSAWSAIEEDSARLGFDPRTVSCTIKRE